jgi:DNA repair exonuclease SbcCD ATPase subunit
VILVPDWSIGAALIIVAASLAKAVPRLMSTVAERIAAREGAAKGAMPGNESLEDVQRRLSEVEERLDFAERLLAQQRESERMAPPKS